MEPKRINPWLVLVVVGIAQFMVILDNTIVNVALPSIQRGLHFSPASLQWIVNAYTLAFGGFLMLGGRAADLVGRRRLFLIGIVLFSAASLMNGLAGSAGILVAGRAVQGLGGALVTPAALSVLTTTFAEGRERTAALGVWSAIAVGGGAVGLLLGGVLTSLLSWQWIFFVNVPVGVVAIALAMRFVPESRSRECPWRCRHRGRRVGHGRPRDPRVRARQCADRGLDLRRDAGTRCHRHCAARDLRHPRGAASPPADPPRHLPDAVDHGRQLRDAADRRRTLRDVLLRFHLRPGGARIQRAPRRTRLPSGDTRHHRGRGSLEPVDPAGRCAGCRDHRHDDRLNRPARPEPDSRSRHLPG